MKTTLILILIFLTKVTFAQSVISNTVIGTITCSVGAATVPLAAVAYAKQLINHTFKDGRVTCACKGDYLLQNIAKPLGGYALLFDGQVWRDEKSLIESRKQQTGIVTEWCGTAATINLANIVDASTDASELCQQDDPRNCSYRISGNVLKGAFQSLVIPECDEDSALVVQKFLNQ
jgi:hypothetical protein